MIPLPFNNLTKDMKVLVRLGEDSPLFESRVVETSYGHPCVPKLRLGKGYSITYGDNCVIYADNSLNRTEVLLEQETIKIDKTLT